MSTARQLKLTQNIPCSRRTRQRWGFVIPTGGRNASGTMPNRPSTDWVASISAPERPHPLEHQQRAGGGRSGCRSRDRATGSPGRCRGDGVPSPPSRRRSPEPPCRSRRSSSRGVTSGSGPSSNVRATPFSPGFPLLTIGEEEAEAGKERRDDADEKKRRQRQRRHADVDEQEDRVQKERGAPRRYGRATGDR